VEYLRDNVSMLDETHLVAAWKLMCASKNLRKILRDDRTTVSIDSEVRGTMDSVFTVDKMGGYLLQWLGSYLSWPMDVYIEAGLTLKDSYTADGFLCDPKELWPESDSDGDEDSDSDGYEDKYDKQEEDDQDKSDEEDEYVKYKIPIEFRDILETHSTPSDDFLMLEINGVRLPLPVRLFEFFSVTGSYMRVIYYTIADDEESLSLDQMCGSDREFGIWGDIALENDIYTHGGCWAISIRGFYM